MILVIGGKASGKRTYVRGLGFDDAEMAEGVLDGRPVLLDLQELVREDARSPEELARALADKRVVACCDIGSGIVPLDAGQRAWRERTGRTLNLLAADADEVIRMVCGIPTQVEHRG